MSTVVTRMTRKLGRLENFIGQSVDGKRAWLVFGIWWAEITSSVTIQWAQWRGPQTNIFVGSFLSFKGFPARCCMKNGLFFLASSGQMAWCWFNLSEEEWAKLDYELIWVMHASYICEVRFILAHQDCLTNHKNRLSCQINFKLRTTSDIW